MIYTVGLTGGIGSGKSTVADQFADLGACVVDTDLISHLITAPGQPALAVIRDQFGADYFRPDGTLDRPRLRQKVFTEPRARDALEAIVHPLIAQESLRQLSGLAGPYALLVVPLLIEGKAYKGLLRRVLVVDCPEELQVSRTMARSQLSAEEVKAIMAAQAARSERVSAADDVIDNSGDTIGLRRQVDALHGVYLQLADAA